MLHAFSFQWANIGYKKLLICSVFLLFFSTGIQFIMAFSWGSYPIFFCLTLIIAFIPLILVDGVFYRYIQNRILYENDDEFSSREDILEIPKMGLRLRIVIIIYSLPAIICGCYFIFDALLPLFDNLDNIIKFNNTEGWLLFLDALLNSPLPLCLGFLFWIASLIFIPPATINMIAEDDLKAAFQTNIIWILLKQNYWNFILPAITIYFLYKLLSLTSNLLWIKLNLPFIHPALFSIVIFYTRMASTRLFCMAYSANKRLIINQNNHGNIHAG